MLREENEAGPTPSEPGPLWLRKPKLGAKRGMNGLGSMAQPTRDSVISGVPRSQKLPLESSKASPPPATGLGQRSLWQLLPTKGELWVHRELSAAGALSLAPIQGAQLQGRVSGEYSRLWKDLTSWGK